MPKCGKCHSYDIIKNGFQNGKQRYKCKLCNFNFVADEHTSTSNATTEEDSVSAADISEAVIYARTSTVIIWLILFFPVGLFLMWKRTHWLPIVKWIVTGFFASAVFAGIFTSNTNNSNGNGENVVESATGITGLSFSRNDDIELNVGGWSFEETHRSLFRVRGNRDFSLDDIEFISVNPEIATFEYESTAFTTTIYFIVTAVSPGETIVYAQTNDGLIRTEEVRVIVTGDVVTEPVTEPATEATTTTPVTTPATTTPPTVATTPAPTPPTTVTTTPAPAQLNPPSTQGLYATPTGQRYHRLSQCGGENSRPITRADIERRGLTPCGTCW